MSRFVFPFAGVIGLLLLSACGGGSSSSYAPPAVMSGQSKTVATAATESEGVAFFPPAAPLVVYVGFTHKGVRNKKYGKIAFYAPTTGKTAPIAVKAGSSLAFLNDDTTTHTASGLGTTGFPKSYDNKSGIKAVGTQIDGGLTWASGKLNPGQQSKTFSVPTAGTYYFGCYYHYHVTPPMRDVIVAS